MASKFSFWGKKALSKRAAALLDEINQSKGMETIKEAKQALSKRAAALLDEINQSKGMETIKEAKQALSKRAADLLDEINQSKGVETIKEVSKLVSESLGMEAEETNIPEAPPMMNKKIVSHTKKNKHKRSHANVSAFNSILYRSLTGGNKLYLWAVQLIILVSLFLFLSSQGIVQLSQNIKDHKVFTDTMLSIKSTQDMTQEKLKSNEKEKLAEELKLKKVNQKITTDTMKDSDSNPADPIKKAAQYSEAALLKEADTKISQVPNLLEVQNYSDDITRLFELSNIVIIKQSIQKTERYNKTLDVDPPVYTFPQEEDSNLSSVASASAPAGASANANKASATATANPLPVKNPPPLPAPAAPPSGVNFMTYEFTLRGGYLNYLKARNALTRILPSVNIPYEDIVRQPDKKVLELRVMIEIPYRLK